MKLALKYWCLWVFVGLTIKIFSDQKFLFSSQPYWKIPINYGAWPAKIHQEASGLAAAKDGQVLMFRGNPAREGWVEGNVGSEYSEQWRFPYFNNQIHSAAKSSPIVDDDGIYVGSDTGWFYCFDFDGKVKWRLYNALSLKGVHGTAIVDGDLLFFGDYAGYLHAVNKKTGETLWSRWLGETLGASPLVMGDYIYANVELVPANGYITKLNKYTGTMVFKSASMGEQSHSSPSFDKMHRHIVFGANNNIFFSTDVELGTFGWSYLAKGQIKDTPVVYKGIAYYTDWAPQFYGTDLSNGHLKFAKELKTRSQSSPALAKTGIVVADRSQLYLFSFNGDLLREVSLGNKTHIGSPLVVHDGEKETILTVCNETDLCRLDNQLSNRRVLFKGTKPLSAVPFVYKDLIILAQNEGDLVVLKRRK